MLRVITLFILSCLLTGLVGCSSNQTAYCRPTAQPKPLRSTVFNTPVHQELAQYTGQAYSPVEQTWYYSRNDQTPAVYNGYVTHRSESRVTVTRDNNSAKRDDYNHSSYTRREQTINW